MAEIGKYPVRDSVSTSDQFVTYETSTGQVVRVPFSLIQQMLATTFRQLSDTPGSYIGQQGNTLAVNNTEDALEFVPNNLSPSFITLPDTPAGYGGNSNKTVKVNLLANALKFEDATFLENADTPSSYSGQANKKTRVNTGETALEFVTDSFTSLSDTPASLSGLAGQMFRVNVGETALEAVDIPLDSLTFDGILNYNHSGTPQAYTAGSGYVKILNDAAGAQTNLDFPPPSVSTIYDPVTSTFDFSGLKPGDQVDFRIDGIITTTAPNQLVQIRMNLAIGGSNYQIQYVNQTVKNAGPFPPTRYSGIYLVDSNTIDNPAQFEISSDANCTLVISGWYCKVIERGI